MADLDALELAAIRFAKQQLEDGKDWQEVQFDLLNEARFQPLFPSIDEHEPEVSDEDGAEAMRIIRAAEEELGWV